MASMDTSNTNQSQDISQASMMSAATEASKG